MIEQDKEIHLEGIPLSEGIGTGIFFLSKGKEASIPEFAISSCRVSYEIARYRRAISSSRDELQHLYKRLEDEGSYEVCGIIDTHIQMLSDPIIADSVEEKIAHMRQNTESVFMYVIDDYKRMFRRHIKGDVADERLLDLKDLSSRILSHLNTQPTKNALCGQPNSIYADHEIVPTKAAEAKKGFIKGFISKIGGEKSHSAIIARAKGIPFVSGIDLSLLEDLEKKPAIIDGFTGKVIISPSKETLEKYLKKSRGVKKMFTAAITSDLGLKTRDGKSVHVSANFDCMDDLEKLLQNNISHVGLIRTEFLFLQDAVTTLSMQFQVEKYEEIIKGAGGALLTFRLFDIGSDKKIIEMDELEPNPALGCRSIRFLMKYPEIFLLQVKALYVASLKGNIRLLLPLVTDFDELLTALSFIENARREISKEMNRDIPKLKIGCMVEVPSFALLSDHFAKACDFFSIGTNDLMQYTLAMDRICPESESIFQMYHPSIIRLIKEVVDSANKEGIEVSICGEAASHPQYTQLLVGLGITDFSCSVRYVPLIRETLAQINTKDAIVLAEKALESASVEDIHMLMKDASSHLSLIS
ncbi:MAG: Phosphoenolpyruvate-protein phosphotransferase [Chlamydiia bacterium]|nr:Phosphoenolpyruvate-protein phosphotransferase [Chlamydiia bacterium]